MTISNNSPDYSSLKGKLNTIRIIRMVIVICVLCGVMLLEGCAVVAVGGAVAAGASVVHDRREASTVLEDQSIEIKAMNAFYRDDDIREKTHISVVSYNKIVILTGEAPTEVISQRVYELAGGISKVKHVFNELAIMPPSTMGSRSSDAVLLTKVKGKLVTVKGLDPTRIKVVVERGTVYLIGLVTEKEAIASTEVARRVSGVQRVVKLFEFI